MGTMSQDFYELLGVERTADATMIKKAFRKRARELHPDVNPEPTAEAQFRRVTEAYEVLSDDERRSIYDRYGEDGLKQQHWQPQYASFGNIADIFSAFFGDDALGGAARGRGRPGAVRGDNVVVQVRTTFAEAALGVEREVVYEALAPCAGCDGRGAASPEGISTCDGCDGIGIVRTVARSLFGQVIQESACPRCGGRGEMVIDPCSTCGGSGEQMDQHSITVNIPGGIADGQRIRLSGRGGAGSGGAEAGNLYIEVAVEHDESFLREGDDLITVSDLTFTEAALGCSKPVPTVDGSEETLEFPAGVQPGEVLRLRGRGVARLRGHGRGDQRIVVNVVVPKRLTDEQRVQLEQYREIEHDVEAAGSERLIDKLRRMIRT